MPVETFGWSIRCAGDVENDEAITADRHFDVVGVDEDDDGDVRSWTRPEDDDDDDDGDWMVGIDVIF